MGKREDWSYWGNSLADNSDALAEIDAICELTGLDRAQVDRLILIEWAKARRGEISALWGVSFAPLSAHQAAGQTAPVAQPQRVPQETVTATPTKRETPRNKNAAAALADVDLDL